MFVMSFFSIQATNTPVFYRLGIHRAAPSMLMEWKYAAIDRYSMSLLIGS